MTVLNRAHVQSPEFGQEAAVVVGLVGLTWPAAVVMGRVGAATVYVR